MVLGECEVRSETAVVKEGRSVMFARTGRTILALLMLSIPAALLAADDPLMGNWKLNVAKSRYDTGKPPQSYTRRHEPIPGGMKVAREETDAEGNIAHPAWAAKFDGKDYPIKGEPGNFVDS